MAYPQQIVARVARLARRPRSLPFLLPFTLPLTFAL